MHYCRFNSAAGKFIPARQNTEIPKNYQKNLSNATCKEEEVSSMRMSHRFLPITCLRLKSLLNFYLHAIIQAT